MLTERLPSKRIDRVEIITGQLRRAERFYTELMLELTVKARGRIERSDLRVPVKLVYLDLGGTVIG